MTLWKDSQNQIHDDNDGQALSLPSWPKGMTTISKEDADALLAPSADELLKNLEIQIRLDRNAKLDALDKKINYLEDNGLDASAFRKYRQALRDVPEQVGFPNTITWPTEPV